MAITKQKPLPVDVKSPDQNAVQAFIAGAIESPVERPRGVIKGKKQQITLTIKPELLDQVDAMAARLGQSRAAIITMSVQRAVEYGLMLDGSKS